LSSSEWREVQLSPELFDKLKYYLQELDVPSEDLDIYRDYFQHGVEAFRELWNELSLVCETNENLRYYTFYGDDIPVIIFFGRLKSVDVYDLAIVEETVVVYDIVIHLPEV